MSAEGVTPKFSASFKEFSLTKNVELVSTDAYFHSTVRAPTFAFSFFLYLHHSMAHTRARPPALPHQVDHVANFLTTELPSNSKFHTTVHVAPSL